MKRSLTILSHNACWFQGFPYDGLDPDLPHPEVFDRLTMLYRSLEPDAVCVQEVQHARMADRVAATLGMDSHYAPGGEYPIYGCSTLARTVEPVVDGSTVRPAPHRAWQICTVSTDSGALAIANVHLTSDRFIGKAAAARQRVEDLNEMLARGAEADVICGDFNEGPREDAAVLLEGHGYTDAAIATGYELSSTGVGKLRSDQIWVRNALVSRVERFGAADWDSLAFDAPGKDVLSDHLPLWLSLRG